MKNRLEVERAKAVLAFLEESAPLIAWGIMRTVYTPPSEWTIFAAFPKAADLLSLGTVPLDRFECVWEKQLADAEWVGLFSPESTILNQAGVSCLKALIGSAQRERERG